MGVAVDTIVGSATNPGATVTAVTFATGDSGAVRNSTEVAPTLLEGIWRNGAAAGVVRVRSPLLHDFAQALRFRGLAANADRLTAHDFAQVVRPQDTLTVEVTGGAAEVDSAALQIWYGDLPGASAILKMPGDIMGSIEQYIGQEVATTSGAAAGGWGDTAVNATFDNFKANRWYAVIGYETDAKVTAIALKGPDTSNLRVGGPGSTTRQETRDYFARLSEKTGRPHIPVFNSANKSGTFVSTNDVGAATTANVTLICALLSPSWAP